jgi:hypothetical protein
MPPLTPSTFEFFARAAKGLGTRTIRVPWVSSESGFLKTGIASSSVTSCLGLIELNYHLCKKLPKFFDRSQGGRSQNDTCQASVPTWDKRFECVAITGCWPVSLKSIDLVLAPCGAKAQMRKARLGKRRKCPQRANTKTNP